MLGYPDETSFLVYDIFSLKAILYLDCFFPLLLSSLSVAVFDSDNQVRVVSHQKSLFWSWWWIEGELLLVPCLSTTFRPGTVALVLRRFL